MALYAVYEVRLDKCMILVSNIIAVNLNKRELLAT